MDAGAFIWDTAWLFAKNTDCNIIVLEPDNENYNLCKKNIKLNNLKKRVELIKVGLGITDSKADLNLAGGLGAYLNYSDDGEIKITTIDSLVKSKPIDDLELIKMDIEGFELDAIKGGKNTIKNSNKN